MGTEDASGRQLFPPPPPYYKRAAVPGQLEPPPVVEGTYQQFGELFTTEDGMPRLQVTQRFERRSDGSIDVKSQLVKLQEELNAAVLGLLEVLSSEPSSYARHVENIGTLIRNMQYLIHELRPLQAKVSLRERLLEDVQRRRHMLERLKNRVQEPTALADEVLGMMTGVD